MWNDQSPIVVSCSNAVIVILFSKVYQYGEYTVWSLDIGNLYWICAFYLVWSAALHINRPCITGYFTRIRQRYVYPNLSQVICWFEHDDWCKTTVKIIQHRLEFVSFERYLLIHRQQSHICCWCITINVPCHKILLSLFYFLPMLFFSDYCNIHI